MPGEVRMTWKDFGKFIGVTIVVFTTIVGGMQYLFNYSKQTDKRLIQLETQLDMIENNHLNHLEEKVDYIKECQDKQRAQINNIDKTTVKILEKIK